MNELRQILESVSTLARLHIPSVLATVVDVQGSTYRRPGARMLMPDEGPAVGLISGGCVDTDLREHAADVIRTGMPRLVTYDSTSPADIVFGLGIGCNGIMKTLLERLDGPADYLKFIAESLDSRQRSVAATVFSGEGQSRNEVGARLMLGRNGPMTGNIRDAQLRALLERDAEKAMESGTSGVVRHELASGSANAFIEVIEPPLSLVIFGAGPDALPLAGIAGELGWHVTIVDRRPAYARKEFFPTADRVILADQQGAYPQIPLSPNDAAVIMTHNFEQDRQFLKLMLLSPVRYIGLLGPKHKAELLLRSLEEEGVTLTDEQHARLYGPVGLDIGAETPQEIALAIAGEIQMVLAGREGGPLRNRQRPIHR